MPAFSWDNEFTYTVISVAELTTAQGWIQAMRPLPPEVTEELRHRFEVAFTYHSSANERATNQRDRLDGRTAKP